jgi:hypothetical protein
VIDPIIFSITPELAGGGHPKIGGLWPRFRSGRASPEPHPWVSRCWHIAPVGSAMKTW